jgi:hypothetical protein
MVHAVIGMRHVKEHDGLQILQVTSEVLWMVIEPSACAI